MNFLNPKKNPLLTAVDYFNFFGTFEEIFSHDKKCVSYSDTSAMYLSDAADTKSPTFELVHGTNLVKVKKSSPYDNLIVGELVTKTMLLTAVRFKGNKYHALTYIEYFLLGNEVPYIRVGVDYFKRIIKSDRYGVEQTQLKKWEKSIIVEDHGKNLIQLIDRFDDFTILPNNKTFIPSEGGCYNLYNKFAHAPVNHTVELDEIQTTVKLINHIFGEHAELGLRYLQILYLYPTQILPVLALVSTERETGKTTFLNYIQMIFGDNSTLINPTDLMSSFNDAYATKNIVMIDETVIDKQHTVEKLKSLATAKSLSVSQKFVQHYNVPFFGKIIVCTNKETDFMRIDEEEIRFWVRKIKPIQGKKNTNIENDLRNEIPAFLKYLEQLPAPDFSRSRMVFTKEEIETESLTVIKDESKSGLRKELEEYINDFFLNNETNEFEATAKDLKERFFLHNNQISINYIRKVLKDEFKLNPSEPKKYKPFDGFDILGAKNDLKILTGRVFLFKNQFENVKINNASDDEPF